MASALYSPVKPNCWSLQRKYTATCRKVNRWISWSWTSQKRLTLTTAIANLTVHRAGGPTAKQKPRQKQSCHKCGGFDHWKAQCNSTGAEKRPDLHCNICGPQGHSQVKCRPTMPAIPAKTTTTMDNSNSNRSSSRLQHRQVLQHRKLVDPGE